MISKLPLLLLAGGISTFAASNHENDNKIEAFFKKSNELRQTGLKTEESETGKVLYISEVIAKDASSSVLGSCSYDDQMRMTQFLNGFMGGFTLKEVYTYEGVIRHPATVIKSMVYYGTEMNPQRFEYRFYPTGLIEGYKLQNPDGKGGWNSVTNIFHRYDLEGRLKSSVEVADWNDLTQTGDSTRRWDYEYDKYGNRKLQTIRKFAGSSWSEYERFEETYDESTGKLIYRNTPASVTEYVYDAAGNLIQEKISEKVSGDLTPKNLKTNTYIDNLIQEELHQTWEVVTNGNSGDYAWVNTLKRSYTYNNSGKIETEWKYFWIEEDWRLNSRISCTYEQGLMTLSLMEETNSYLDPTLYNAAKMEYSYHQNGKLYEYEGYAWENNEWIFKEGTVTSHLDLDPERILPYEPAIYFQSLHNFAKPEGIIDMDSYYNYTPENRPKEECLVEELSFNATYIATEYIPVNAVSLNTSEIFLSTTGEGSLFEIVTAEIEPRNATYPELVWWSDNVNVANINSLGQVIAVGSGKCHIGITSTDGSKIAYATVTVNEGASSISQSGMNVMIGNMPEGILVRSGESFSGYELFDLTGRFIGSGNEISNSFYIELPKQNAVYILKLKTHNSVCTYKVSR